MIPMVVGKVVHRVAGWMVFWEVRSRSNIPFPEVFPTKYLIRIENKRTTTSTKHNYNFYVDIEIIEMDRITATNVIGDYFCFFFCIINATDTHFFLLTYTQKGIGTRMRQK